MHCQIEQPQQQLKPNRNCVVAALSGRRQQRGPELVNQ